MASNLVVVPDKAEIARELEATRTAYHDLLRSMTQDIWDLRSRNSDLMNRELMWHIAWSMAWLANGAEAVRAGNRPTISRLPMPVVEPLRRIAMRWLARGATHESAKQKYDNGHSTLISQLDSVSDDAWGLTTVRFGETRSLEWHFRQPALHLREHAADVRV